jgi:hypothetical protein
VQRFLLERLYSNRKITIDILVQRIWAQDGRYGAGYVKKYIRPHGLNIHAIARFLFVVRTSTIVPPLPSLKSRLGFEMRKFQAKVPRTVMAL